MIDPTITSPDILNYITGLFPELPPAFHQIDAQARAEGHPIVSKDAGWFLHLMVQLLQTRRILEIGCSIGYSALWMGTALGEGCTMDTIEINPENAYKAEENFKSMGLSHQIHIHVGAALDVLPKLEGPYDLVFIDAVKTEYIAYLELALPRLRTKGLVLVDNVLWSGRVVNPDVSPEEYSTKALQQFNHYFMHHDQLDATILSIGDGLGFGVKR